MNHAAPPLTVIVPSYRRPDSAIRAIRSLQAQDIDVEILLVDNEADPAMRDAIAALNVGARLAATWIPESRLGAHHARHAGALHARSELLGFIDDDATCSPEWARAYVEAFAAHPEMTASGGPLLPEWDAAPPRWLQQWVNRQQFCMQLGFRDDGPDFRLGPREMFWSGNMAIRKSELFGAGGFNTDLVGAHSIGDGEVGLFDRLLERGALIGYVPNAVVRHHVPPERMNADFLRRRTRNEGGVDVYGLVREFNGPIALYLGWLAVRNGIAAGIAWLMAAPVFRCRDYYSLWIQLRAERLTGRAACAWRALLDVDFRNELLRDDELRTR